MTNMSFSKPIINRYWEMSDGDFITQGSIVRGLIREIGEWGDDYETNPINQREVCISYCKDGVGGYSH